MPVPTAQPVPFTPNQAFGREDGMLLLAGVTTAVHNSEECFNAAIPVRHPDACTMAGQRRALTCVLIWRKSRVGEHRSGLATEGAICIEQCVEQNILLH